MRETECELTRDAEKFCEGHIDRAARGGKEDNEAIQHPGACQKNIPRTQAAQASAT